MIPYVKIYSRWIKVFCATVPSLGLHRHSIRQLEVDVMPQEPSLIQQKAHSVPIIETGQYYSMEKGVQCPLKTGRSGHVPSKANIQSHVATYKHQNWRYHPTIPVTHIPVPHLGTRCWQSQEPMQQLSLPLSPMLTLLRGLEKHLSFCLCPTFTIHLDTRGCQDRVAVTEGALWSLHRSFSCSAWVYTSACSERVRSQKTCPKQSEHPQNLKKHTSPSWDHHFRHKESTQWALPTDTCLHHNHLPSPLPPP